MVSNQWSGYERIQRLHELHESLSLDPDFNGERIRRMIMTVIPTVQHVFLNEMKRFLSPRLEAVLGIEHASYEDLKTAPAQVTEQFKTRTSLILVVATLIRLGFLAGASSHALGYLGEQLCIGYSNGKQLLKRLELFGVTRRSGRSDD